MILKIIKTILKHVTVTVHWREGDLVRFKLLYKGVVVLDKEFDIMPTT